MTATARLSLSLSGAITLVAGIGESQHDFNESLSKSLANGTAADQIDVVYDDEQTLTLGQTVNLDLNGTLLDKLGQAANFVKLRGLWLKAPSTNLGNITIGAAGANPWVELFGATGTFKFTPNRSLLVWDEATAGMPVIAATGDILKLVNNDGVNSNKLRIVLLGTSA